MMLFKIAFRNILRNGRRSLMTASAIAVGAIALILFGEYKDFLFYGLQTSAVMSGGHLTVYQKGYFEFGSGNPAGYSISHYREVMKLIEEDPVLKPMLNVVTPTVSLFGIAGNFSLNASKIFMGSGFVPSDREKMRHWDEYHLLTLGSGLQPLGLKDADINRGVVGTGVARVLGLCGPLKVPDCPPMPERTEAVDRNAPPPSVDLAELAARDRAPADAAGEGGSPRLDLLSATANGSPNVVSFYVGDVFNQGMKEFDDVYVGMHLTLAQELLYGRGEHKAVALVIQLRRTEDLGPARTRMAALFAEHHLPLEIHDFDELNPHYVQIRNFMGMMFGFLSIIMGVIVVFTVINTMSMSVMERTNEIGTARAMGVRRGSIRLQFVVEGLLLGIIGVTVGVVFGTLLAMWFNASHIMYTPPGAARQVNIRLLVDDVPLLVKTAIALVLIATIGSLIPAGRAAKMKVVDALRHV